jgi:hypothetical protein
MRIMGWKALGVLTVAVAMLAGGKASAEMINATFGYVPIGSTTFIPPGNVGTATSVTVPATEIVNTIPTTFLGKPNDFFSGPASFALGNSVTVNPLTLSPMFVNDGLFHPEVLSGYLTFASGTTPANRFVFDMSSIRWASSGPQELDFAALGTIRQECSWTSRQTSAAHSHKPVKVAPSTHLSRSRVRPRSLLQLSRSQPALPCWESE